MIDTHGLKSKIINSNVPEKVESELNEFLETNVTISKIKYKTHGSGPYISNEYNSGSPSYSVFILYYEQ